MARNYANIITAIWRDEDFRRLASSSQRLYLLLVTQPEISACGVLPLRLRRWAALAPDTTEASLTEAMRELEVHRFVVVDEVTEELLVRSFTRHDGGHGNRKRQPSIRDAADAVESEKLLQVLAEEFERVQLPIVFRGKAKPQANSLSDAQCHAPRDGLSPSERVVVTQGPYIETPTLNPQTANPSPLPPEPDRSATSADPPPTTEEGGINTQQDREDTLVAEVRGVRPEWSAASIRRAIRHPDVAERPWPILAAALLAVARDGSSTAPGRLRADGPWWATAAREHRPDPVVLSPPCGECDTNRLVDVPGGMARCPRCHPLRKTA